MRNTRNLLAATAAAAALATMIPSSGAEATAARAASLPATTSHVATSSTAVAPSMSEVELRPASTVPGSQAGAATGMAALGADEVLLASPATTLRRPLTVVGATWSAESGRAARVQLRTRTSAGWTAWSEVDVDRAKGEESTEERRAAQLRTGSDPVVVTGAVAVQVRVVGVRRDLPTHARVQLIDPGADRPAPAGATSAQDASGVAAVAGQPVIRSRAAWGADESLRRSGPIAVAAKGVVIHHTAGTNAYTKAQVPAILRGIYAFHVKGRGWNDIAYNFLVDKWGRIWQGRAGDPRVALQGAHTKGHNSYAMGISLLGDYTSVRPSGTALESIARIVAWKAALHEFSPYGVTAYYGRTYNTVAGHRDIGQTTCPGRYLYAKLGWIRSRAGSLLGYRPSLTLRRDLDHQMGSDIIVRAEDGTVEYLSAGVNGAQGIAPVARRLPGDWTAYDHITIAGDLDSDGDVDLVARHVASGALHFFASDSRGGFAPARRIGSGWSGMRHIVAPGDVTGDGRADLYAVTSDGILRLYAGRGNASFGPAVSLGRGWGLMTQVVGVGDVDGDGKRDLVAVRTGKSGLLYRGSGTGGFREVRRLDGDWSDRAGLTGVSDTDGDGRTELYWTSADGSGWLGKWTGPRQLSTTTIGSTQGLTSVGG